jgi:hypothetical protein
MKDSMDHLSFTMKSRDDPFGANQAFPDYSFSNVDPNKDWERSISPSPMTRRMKVDKRERSLTPTKGKPYINFTISVVIIYPTFSIFLYNHETKLNG